MGLGRRSTHFDDFPHALSRVLGPVDTMLRLSVNAGMMRERLAICRHLSPGLDGLSRFKWKRLRRERPEGWTPTGPFKKQLLQTIVEHQDVWSHRLTATGMGCHLWLLVANDEQDVSPRVEIVSPGTTLTLLAEHPGVVTPTGIDVDDDGNVWVIASHTHFRPEEYSGPEHDEVVVLGRDGKRQVFYNDTDATMGLKLGPDGWVYLAERDRLIRVRDSDDDRIGDEVQTVATLHTESGLSSQRAERDGLASQRRSYFFAGGKLR